MMYYVIFLISLIEYIRMAEFRGLLPVDQNKIGSSTAMDVDLNKNLDSLRQAATSHAESVSCFVAFLDQMNAMVPDYFEENAESMFRFKRFQFLLLLKEKKQMEALSYLRQVLSK